MSVILTCRDIAYRHKLSRTRLGWRGNCPACSYTEAFTMRESRAGTPMLYCASCRDPEAIARAVGQEPRAKDPREDEDRAAYQRRMREAALRLWNSSEPAWQTLAMGYLMSRHIHPEVARCPELRFRLDCPHPEGGKLPAMIALVRDASGEPVGVHRTYLRLDGSAKADVRPAKASLGPIWGGVVRLAPLAAEIVVGEGIETAAAAGLLAGLPAWAAISAGNLATGLVLPVGVRAVVVAVDRDPAGEQAASRAASRWRAEGRHVRLLLPNEPGTDAADLLQAQVAGHA